MNGSVDWANRWPRECFIIEPPQISLRKEPDFRKMARDAKAYAKAKMRKEERERRRAAGEEVSDSEEEPVKTEPSGAAGQHLLQHQLHVEVMENLALLHRNLLLVYLVILILWIY